MSNCTVETCTVETSDGVKLSTRLFKPREEINKGNPVVVLVHPYSVLGGCQGLLRGIAAGLADRGYKAVTFDMRGVGRSTGRASLTGFAEIKDVIAVCKWVCENLSADRILLVGSSAGAPIAGSAVDQIEQVVGYVSLGYPFGMIASILFGRHHKAVLQSPKPKIFIMGTKDGFTSVQQLKNKLRSAAGRVETHLIEGVSHFQMEGPAYDAQMELSWFAYSVPSQCKIKLLSQLIWHLATQ
ncbi:hypothetical protein PRUPE_6G018000 [Prunus persica]|uniref:PREDICTED: alpha/beta hydrolase n=2 Tax=Prunus TaxID=3754 RepID=A0A5E4FW58_PRUDU|nr:uncharacterized protein RP471 isoform X1 [Prunus dulcis]KAI5321199.1 hypothetical protein L3X38_030270 [Prunus dulcis]ONH99207.1 hypothetical protein PRUPE_6G018000 [Prunus persica]VVA31703.1 PREDICTED: alpha/beta hydrolase [Prunus dulcis]